AMLQRRVGTLRINLAHGNARSTREVITRVRQAARATGHAPALLFDLPGGKLRLGRQRGEVVLRVGQTFTLEPGASKQTTQQGAGINTKVLAAHVTRGDRLLLDDGKLALRVVRVDGQRVVTKVERGGALRARLGLAIEGKELPFANLLASDRRRIRIAVENGATHLGVSMVQRPEQLHAVRRALARLGRTDIKIVAKIETRSALANLDAILAASDEVMIARGDLRQAVGGSTRALRRAEAKIAARCQAAGVSFINATGFMSAMMHGDAPSKRNLRDVERAVKQGASRIMLNETAVGPRPLQTLEALQQALGQ
ncbi:MAG: hypothetical protein KC503_30330, partial [Myxococcales bacterium]|nr:hypothetical protein [Myxococcales bacterium]